MTRHRPRPPTLGLGAVLGIVLALACVAAPGWGGRADAEEEAAGLRWAASWEDAARRARAADRLRFVYYARKRPPCPPCRQLEAAVFADPAGALLGTRYVAVRLLAGEDADETTRAVARRYGIRGAPTLLALAPDGGLLARAFPRDLEGILATLATAETTEAEFRAAVARLGASARPEDVRALAARYAARANWSEARRRYAQLVASTPTPAVADHEALLGVLAAMGDDDARADLLRTMIATHATHARRIQWRIALVLLSSAEARTRRDGLQALLAAVTTNADRAAVHLRLADVLATLRARDAAMASWDWILAHAPTRPEAADALHRKAVATLRRGQGLGDLTTIRAARDLLVRFLAEHPEHAEAGTVRRLRFEAERIIAQLEAKPARDPK